ncbi:FERM central domain [Trinorchestia longiramus]|nr:FERM central domain [Trinorchestia longiramus]
MVLGLPANTRSKHLLFESWLQLDEPVEKELIYFQVLYTLRADKFPVTQMEAVMLCALRAQIELGNYTGVGTDYGEVIGHTLSPRLLSVVTHEAVSMHHQSLFNMDPLEAKQAFLNLIKSWPLYRATIFDVTQSFTSNWSKVLWLAVDEAGVHLLEHRSRNVLCIYEYDYILNYSASITSLMIITGSTSKQSKIILNTTQAFMIATLIKDYAEVYKESLAASEVAVNINDLPPPPQPHRISAPPPPQLYQTQHQPSTQPHQQAVTQHQQPVPQLQKPVPQHQQPVPQHQLSALQQQPPHVHQHQPLVPQHPPPVSQHQPPVPQHPPPVSQHQPPVPQHQPPVPQHQPLVPQHQPPVPQHQPPVPQHQPPVPQHQPPVPQHQLEESSHPVLRPMQQRRSRPVSAAAKPAIHH